MLENKIRRAYAYITLLSKISKVKEKYVGVIESNCCGSRSFGVRKSPKLKRNYFPDSPAWSRGRPVRGALLLRVRCSWYKSGVHGHSTWSVECEKGIRNILTGTYIYYYSIVVLLAMVPKWVTSLSSRTIRLLSRGRLRSAATCQKPAH